MEFHPEQKVLNDVFAKDMTYIIPDYQRPYSWDCIGKSDKNNQVNVMWQDLIDFYRSGNVNIYFLGSMVVIGEPSKRNYQVVDGQQRLTTLTLLFISVKCFLNSLNKEQFESVKYQELEVFVNEVVGDLDDLVFNKKKFGSLTQTKKVKIERKIGFDYDKVLEEAIKCGSISNIDLLKATDEQKRVSKRFFANQEYFISMLQECFMDNDIFTYSNAKDLNGFIEFLKNKVTVIQIRAQSFDVAYQVFEILNNRGLPLSNKDLFRNFLISEFSKLVEDKNRNDIIPSEKWYDLEQNYELDVEFVSRYVESRRAKKLKQSAFNGLKDIYDNIFKDTLTISKIESFYSDIQTNLIIYSKIRANNFQSRELQNRVTFLLNCGNTRHIFNLLMAVFRNVSDEETDNEILKEYEKYIMYIILGPAKRFSAKPIFDAIQALNENKQTSEVIENFKLDTNEIADLRNYLNNEITDNNVAKLMIAKYIWAFDNINPDDVTNTQLDYDKATLEHIIPQNPENNSNWLKDFTTSFRDDYTYVLGNMTLLTNRSNSAARNFDFHRKKNIYAGTQLHTTNALSKLSTITEDYIEKRHEEITDVICKDLNI